MMVAFSGGSSFAHHISGGLWIGNAPPILSYHEKNTSDNMLKLSEFDVLILCAEEYQPDGGLFPVEEVVHAPMRDDFVPIRRETAKTATFAAARAISRLAAGDRVLVTCLAGRNRSGLVCALSLCFGNPRVSAEEAIHAVKKARGSMALANPFFVKFVQSVAK